MVKKNILWVAILYAIIGLLVLAKGVSADIDSDLVLGLHFENDSSIGEDNTHVSDYRGNGLNGTKSAGGQYFGGIFNGFLNNSCVNIPDNNLLDMREQYTMSVWINLPAGAMSTYYLIQKGDGDRYDFLWYSSREGRITHFTTGGGNVDSNGGGLNNSNWVHLTGTYNISTGLKTYVNGVLNASLAPTTTNITVGVAGLGIGCGYAGDALYAGALDEFRLYNRTLTADEVQELYEEDWISSSSSSSSSSLSSSATTLDTSSTSSSESSSSSLVSSSSSIASSTSALTSSSSSYASSSAYSSSIISSLISSALSSSSSSVASTTLPDVIVGLIASSSNAVCSGSEVASCGGLTNETHCITSYTIINSVYMQCYWAYGACNKGVRCTTTAQAQAESTSMWDGVLTTFFNKQVKLQEDQEASLSAQMEEPVGEEATGVIAFFEAALNVLLTSVYYLFKVIQFYFLVFIPNMLLFIILGECIILGYILATSSRDGIADMVKRLITYNYAMFNLIFASMMMVYTISHMLLTLISNILSGVWGSQSEAVKTALSIVAAVLAGVALLALFEHFITSLGTSYSLNKDFWDVFTLNWGT
jgi:hypothetical protein